MNFKVSPRRNKLARCIAGLFVGSLAALIPIQSAQAAAGTWTQSVAGTYNWSDIANWNSGAGPIADGATFNAAFNIVGGGNIITTLDTARTIGGISRGGTGTATQANWTITHASNVLTLDNGASNVNISNGVNAISVLTIDTELLLNSNLVITANGNNNAAINLGTVVGGHTITGAKNITFASSSGSGNGAITINDNISTTGAIFNLGTGASNPGAINIAGIIGSGVTGVTQNGTGTMSLSGANLYTSATTIGTAGSTASGGTLTVSGTLGSINQSSGYAINGSGSRLLLDNTAGNVDRLKDTVSVVNLNLGGELSLTGNATTNTTETMAGLALGSGNGIVTVSSGGAGRVTTLAASALTRSSNGTALVRGTSLDQSAGTNVSRITLGTAPTGADFVGTNTLSGGAASDATQALKIVPWLIGDTAVAGTGKNFVTYDSTLGLRVLNATEMTTLVAGSITVANPVNALAFNGTVTTSGLTVNSLLFNTATQTLNGSGDLTVNSGAVAAVAATEVIGSGFSSLLLGNGEGVLTATGTNVLTINTPVNVTSSGGLTKSGGGTVALGASNLYAGVTTVNQGVLQIGTGTAGDLGSNTANIVLNGGSLGFGRTNAGLTIANNISGVGGVIQSGTGTTVLTAANTFTGATTISAGTLALSGGNNRLPSTGTVSFTGTSTLNINSTSQTLAAITVANLVNVSSTINGSGTLTLNGATNFEFGSGGVVPNTTTLTYSLDMSGLSNFTYNASANVFRVGLKAGATNGTNPSFANSTVLLGNTNSITAATLAVGDISGSNHGGTQVLSLGTNNTLNVGAVNIGFSGRTNSTLNFNTGLTNPNVTIRGTAGGSSPVATFNVGSVAQFSTATGLTFTDTVDFSAGTVDAIVTSSIIGQADTGSSTTRAGTVNASVTMGAGSFTVGTMTIGRLAGTSTGTLGATFTANGTFTINNSAGTLNATTINLAENTIQATGAFNRTVTGTLALTNGTVKATTIQLGTQGGINGGATLTVTPRINWTTGIIQNTDSADLTITGVPITLLTSAAHTFHASGTQSIIQASTSPISGATFGITKTGPGLLVLNATNTYTGPTTVSAGNLRVNGSITSAVSVLTGTLDGTGNGATTGLISASVLIGDNSGTSDAILAPGNSVGTLTATGSLTFNSDAVYAVEVNSSFSTTDLMVANGVTINPLASFSFADLGSSTFTPGSYTIIDNTSASPISGTFSNLPDGVAFVNGLNSYTPSYTGGTGNDLVLNVVAIPEPSTLVLGGLALLGFACVGLRRRRLAK